MIIFDKEDEKQFKQQFVAQFLASWTSKHYEDYCAIGMHYQLRNPPFGDAMDLAENAWDEICRINNIHNPETIDWGATPTLDLSRI